MITGRRGVVVAWALGIAGILAGALGAGGIVAGLLIVAGGAVLAGSGLLTVTGRGGVYQGNRLTPFLGALMILIGLLWEVFGAAVSLGGW